MLVKYNGQKDETSVGIAIKFTKNEIRELPEDIAISVLRAEFFEEVKEKPYKKRSIKED